MADVKKADAGQTGQTHRPAANSGNSHERPPPSYDQTVGANIALNSDFISHHPMNLIMNGEPFSRDFEVIDGKGTTVLRVDCPLYSIFHEMTLIHGPTGHSLFTIYKKQFSMSWRYSAEVPPEGSGKTLFETETVPGFFSGGQTFIHFTNAMTGQPDQLEVDLHTYSGPNEVKYKGRKIADIDRERFSIGSKWNIDIHVPGVDPLLIVVLALVIADRLRTKGRRRRA